MESPYLIQRREIKFRAWENNKMFTWEEMINRSQGAGSEGVVIDLLNNKDIVWMQYTGLKDKDGKEIYEGDILELKYFLSSNDDEDNDDYKLITVPIVYQSGGFWFTGDVFTDCNWHFYNESDRKTIGNIYENPELLK